MEQVIKEKWSLILDLVKKETNMSDISYKTWLCPIKIDSFTDGLLFLSIPGMQMVGMIYIRNKYSKILRDAVKNVTGIDCHVLFEIPEESKKCIFDTFTVAPCNSNAYILAGSIAKGYYQGKTPICICGPKYSGKTHLLKAIKNDNQTPRSVYYVPGETFFSELLWDIQNKTQKYIYKYENEYDVLMIDDIDYIPNSKVIQEEMVRLLTVMKTKSRLIIFTNKKELEEMVNLTEELKQFLSNSERIKIDCVIN